MVSLSVYPSSLQSSSFSALLHGGSQPKLFSGQIPHLLEKSLTVDHPPSLCLCQIVNGIFSCSFFCKSVDELLVNRGSGDHCFIHIQLSSGLHLLRQVIHLILFASEYLNVLIQFF